MNKSKRNKLISELVSKTNQELSDEELMHQLLEQKISANTDANKDKKLTFGQKAADGVAKFAGSWAFIFTFLSMMLVWMVINVLMEVNAFDAYPFILLNLVLSCIAAIQAPLIMMSQNRREEKDRLRAENDYKVNLKNELVIADLHLKLDKIIENQHKLQDEINKIKKE